MEKKRVIILGCTGSIGSTALGILDTHRDFFEVVAISAHTSKAQLLSISRDFNVPHICLSNNDNVEIHSQHSKVWLHESGLLEMIQSVDCDIVLNAISGSSGLGPTFACIDAKKDIALANKESIVMGGNLLFEIAKKKGVTIFPVDSEHSTLASLIQAHKKENVASLVITASGGPFRNYSLKEMENVSLQEALMHPTWKMGPKITIDSATLANKGLEVIEASYLFGLPYNQIEVVIHPQSIVHSMIEYKDGSVLSQMGANDMRTPLANVLAWPDRLQTPGDKLDFKTLSDLTFEPADLEQFPALQLAYDALESGPSACIAMNAANEIAVDAYLNNSIAFLDIVTCVKHIMSITEIKTLDSLENILDFDRSIRDLTIDHLNLEPTVSAL